MKHTIQNIAIIAGGTPPDAFVTDIRDDDAIIGADRGALWLISHGIIPDVAIGDFDSVTKVEKSEIFKSAKTMMEYSPIKDATDLELAIDEAVKIHPKLVTIYGGLGGRFDHSLVSIQMLMRLESHNISGQIVDNSATIHIVRRKIQITKDPSCPYVSIIPFGLSVTVSLKGFRYDLLRKKIVMGSSLGVSNEIVRKSAMIVVYQGYAVVIQSSDGSVR